MSSVRPTAYCISQVPNLKPRISVPLCATMIYYAGANHIKLEIPGQAELALGSEVHESDDCCLG
jgi:hypothetical protein